jgi:hypothetical protein
MKPVKVNVSSNASFSDAQSRASMRIPLTHDEMSLVSWYDRKLRTGGPMEACGGQPLKASQDYARANGAEYRVSAGNRYEFFYTSVPEGTEQLDRDELLEIHAEIEYDRYENVQGG